MGFYRERPVTKTRKAHRCQGCLKLIDAGSSALYIAIENNGDTFFGHFHVDCRRAEVELNRLKDWYSGDDWCPLYEIEHDMHDWLRADFPSVAARIVP